MPTCQLPKRVAAIIRGKIKKNAEWNKKMPATATVFFLSLKFSDCPIFVKILVQLKAEIGWISEKDGKKNNTKFLLNIRIIQY